MGGDLVLDGKLNVTATGAFLPGVYRIISYEGSLDNKTLDLQTMPPGTFYVQTSIDKQVNLINSTGLMLNYWDGAAGPKNDDRIDGGDGTWNLANSNDSWTDKDGDVNAPFNNGDFAIFGAKAGKVVVDNSSGQVQAGGMQFLTSGYRIEGQPLELAGGTSTTIRVGDGSADSATYVATIAAQLIGNSQLVMTDQGTLVLLADNAYTGGTRFDGGVVQVSKDSNLGLADTALTFDGGGLQTTTSFSTARPVDLISTGTFLPDTGTSLTLTGPITGAGGSLVMSGLGELVLAGTADYSGDTLIERGTLSAGGANTLSAASAHSVLAGARLNLNGYDQSIAGLKNAGTVDFNGVPGTMLSVTGNYEGAGGLIIFNTVLDDDSSATDRMIVEGDTAGSTNIAVKNAGGTGAQTVQGIKLIDVEGASNGTFALMGDYVFKGEQAVVAGAYAYLLHKGGVSTPGDGDWYLRSELVNPKPDVPPGPVFQPGAPLFEAYPQILLSLMSMPTMRERVGYDAVSGRGRPTPATVSYIDEGGSYLGGPSSSRYEQAAVYREAANAWWGRADASRISVGPSSTTSATYDADQVRLQTGFDALVYSNQAGRFMAGLMVNHGSSRARIDSVYGDGKINAEGYGVGGALAWLGLNGFYVDTQAQVTWFDTDIRSALAGSVVESDDATGWGISVETGKRFASRGPWALTPQAQLSYTSVDFDFTDVFGAAVSARDGESLLGRVGLALDHRNAWAGGSSHLYGIANLYYEFLDGTSVDISGTRLVSQRDELWGGLGLGGTYSRAGDRYAVFGEVSVNSSLEHFGDSYSVNGTAGFRIRW